MSDDERVMNDTTLPKKKSSPSIAAAAPVRRKKTGRFGLADWTRLLQSSKDLAQRKGQPLRKIRWDEIRQHTTVHDGWMVVKGKVYFISPYLAYHPGGEAILKPALGKDATGLFNKYHGWVSEDGYVLCVDAFDLGLVCSLLVFPKGVGPSNAFIQTHAHSNSSPAFTNKRRLIGQLMIGYLDNTPPSDDDSDDEKPSYLPPKISNDGFAVPAPRTKKR